LSIKSEKQLEIPEDDVCCRG